MRRGGRGITASGFDEAALLFGFTFIVISSRQKGQCYRIYEGTKKLAGIRYVGLRNVIQQPMQLAAGLGYFGSGHPISILSPVAEKSSCQSAAKAWLAMMGGARMMFPNLRSD